MDRWKPSLSTEASKDTVVVHGAREFPPIHVGKVQVVVDAPQFRRDAKEGQLFGRAQVHDFDWMIR